MNNRFLNRNIIASMVSVFLFSTGYFCAQSTISEEWWRTATIDDFMKQFDNYLHFTRADENGKTLLMMALQYSKDPHVPMYFILNRQNNLEAVDKYGFNAIDYARKNPEMGEVVKFLQYKRNINYRLLGGEHAYDKFYSSVL